jgi:hypothetical protein
MFASSDFGSSQVGEVFYRQGVKISCTYAGLEYLFQMNLVTLIVQLVIVTVLKVIEMLY